MLLNVVEMDVVIWIVVLIGVEVWVDVVFLGCI